jgi:hypothetical protein
LTISMKRMVVSPSAVAPRPDDWVNQGSVQTTNQAGLDRHGEHLFFKVIFK